MHNVIIHVSKKKEQRNLLGDNC